MLGRRNNNRGSREGNRLCYACGSKGYIAEECRNSDRWIITKANNGQMIIKSFPATRSSISGTPSNALQIPGAHQALYGPPLQPLSNTLQQPSSTPQPDALQALLNSLQQPSNSLQQPSNSLQQPFNSLQQPSNSLQQPSNSLQPDALNSLFGAFQQPSRPLQPSSNPQPDALLALLSTLPPDTLQAALQQSTLPNALQMSGARPNTEVVRLAGQGTEKAHENGTEEVQMNVDQIH